MTNQTRHLSALLHELARFVLSGALGLLVGFGLYEAAFALLPDNPSRATVAWLLSYLFGIGVQHALHRRIVFGTSASYWTSLWRTYAIYAVGSFLAGGLNLILNEATDWHHRLVWLLTMAVVSLLNFVALKLYAFKGTASTGS